MTTRSQVTTDTPHDQLRGGAAIERISKSPALSLDTCTPGRSDSVLSAADETLLPGGLRHRGSQTAWPPQADLALTLQQVEELQALGAEVANERAALTAQQEQVLSQAL